MKLSQKKSNPEFKEYYAYPYEVDLFYNISPEVYSLVSSYLKSKYGKSGNKLKEYIFTEKPLTYYKPGKTFRDTVYTFVNSAGVEHHPLERSTLDYKNDGVSDPVNIKEHYGEYIPKIKENKVKMPSTFSDFVYPRTENVWLRSSTYNKLDVENMNLTEKEKFKQYLKNEYKRVFSDEDLKNLSYDYYKFKLTDLQKQKIRQIEDENIQRYEKFKESF